MSTTEADRQAAGRRPVQRNRTAKGQSRERANRQKYREGPGDRHLRSNMGKTHEGSCLCDHYLKNRQTEVDGASSRGESKETVTSLN